MTSPDAAFPDGDAQLRREAPLALAYFVAYLLYLFVRLENEFLHWGSLVMLPLGIVFLLRWRRSGVSLGGTLESVGLRKGRLSSGLLGATLVGVAFCFLQLLGSRSREPIVDAFRSGRFLYLLPLSFALMMATAGFTEEFFFRGFIQTRLSRWFRSNLLAVLTTAILFGLYHLPYAYLNPRWPSHGDWAMAARAAMGQGVPTGLVLGWVYVRSRENTLACAVTHALINTLPAMLSIRFGG